MKRPRTEWIVLLVLVAMMVVASALVGGGGGDDIRGLLPDPSSYNAGWAGSMGLYLWLEALGVRVRRWEKPLHDLPEDAAVLWLLRPSIPLEESELGAVDRWVRGGGTLVLADDTVGGPIPEVWAGAAALKFGLRPQTGGQPGTVRPAFPSRYVEGVETIRSEGRVRFQRHEPVGWAPLFADEGGDVVAIRRLGRGSLIVVADPGLFSNARIEVAGHARLALNIVYAHAGRGTVLLDEFHHGHGQQGSFLRYVRGTALPWMVAQGALVFLVFALARGTRFGPPVPQPRKARASSLEYAAALGDLYRQAGARLVAAEALAGSFRRSLAEALAAPAGEGPTRLAARAAQRFQMNEGQVKACLGPGPAVAASDDALLRFAGAVHSLEERILPPPGRVRDGGRPAA